MTRYYVIAYKCGKAPNNSCVLDILFKELVDGPQYGRYGSSRNISIEAWPEKRRMENVYPRITKELFESLYGKIEYP